MLDNLLPKQTVATAKQLKVEFFFTDIGSKTERKLQLKDVTIFFIVIRK